MLTGCDSTVTDYESLVKALQSGGNTVEVKRSDTDSSPYTDLYLAQYHDAFESVRESGRTIDPAYYDKTTARMQDIENNIKDFSVRYIDLEINGCNVYVNEYGNEADAAFDAGYAKLIDVPTMTITVPTTTDNMTFMIESMKLGKPHYFLKGSIIVLFIEEYTDDEAIKAEYRNTIELLESLLGPEYYTY